MSRFALGLTVCGPLAALALASPFVARQPGSATPAWSTPAHLTPGLPARIGHQLTFRSGHQRAASAGTLAIDSRGIEFRFHRGKTLRWNWTGIETFNLRSPTELVVRSYENKSWRRPGEREYSFELADAMPAGVAARLARAVGKPSENGVAPSTHSAFASIPARHPTRFGGSNGVVRFGDTGIDYITAAKNDSRVWRWADIQTLANPDPYSLRITGYRETYDLLLKEPLPRAVFERLWDYVYARGLNVSPTAGGGRP